MGLRSGGVDARDPHGDPRRSWSPRGRAKKLTVAFHFQFSDPAAWKCDDCRRQRLDAGRRCAFLPADQIGPEKPVWVRGRLSTTRCPKSLISVESVRCLELFAVWKLQPAMDLPSLAARDVDALFVLEQEWRSLQNHGESE